MIEVGFAELHEGIFVGGKNLTAKLDCKQNSALSLVYDEKEKELLVTWNAVTAHVPFTNIKSYIPGETPDRKVAQKASPMVANVSSTAQVETPMSHVHAGFGHGQTGQETPKKKGK